MTLSMSLLRTTLRRHRWLFLILAVEVPILVHFFTPYPDTWDAAEYSWCLRKGFLPHSPYLVFVLLGRLLHHLLPPPVALSLLSVLSGTASLVLFYVVQSRTLRREGVAAIATLLLAATGVFIRESTHQEVYALQTALILLSAVLASGERPRPGWSGAVFGAAMATHSASLFVAPALLLLVVQASRERARTAGAWTLSAGAAAAAAAVFVVAVVPVDPDQSRIAEGLRYLEGLGSGLHARPWSAGFLAHSLWGQLDRLFAVAGGRVSAPRYPLGFSQLHLVAAAVGAVLSLRRRRAGLVWCLYPLPYLLWEIQVGASPDIGAYLPLVAPAVCALAAVAVDGCVSAPGPPRLAAALVVLGLVTPSAVRVAEVWNRVHDDAPSHFSRQELAALWLDVHLPADAVVVNTVPSTLNSVAYYSGRQPVLVDGRRALIFRDRGRYTPLNARSFAPFSTELLADLVASGRDVVALEADPFRAVPWVDGSRFAWRAVAAIDLTEAAGLAASSRAVGDRLMKGRIELYRAFLPDASR